MPSHDLPDQPRGLGAAPAGDGAGAVPSGSPTPSLASALADVAREALLVLDSDLRVQAANAAFYTTFSVGPDETVGRRIYDVGEGAWDVPQLYGLLEEVLPREHEVRGVTVHHTYGGAGRRCALLSARRLAADGRVVLAVEDVTDRERRERELRAFEQEVQAHLEELQATYATAPVGLCVLDADLRFVRVNQRLAEMNGLSVEDHIGRTVREVVPGLADVAEPILRKILETGEPVVDMEVTGATPAYPGETRTWLEDWYPLRDSRGGVVGINVVAEDVTEQRAEERRRTALLDLGDRLRSAEGPDRMERVAAEVLGELLGADRAGLGAVSEDEEIFVVAADWRAGAGESSVGTHRLAAYWPGFVEELRSDRAVCVQDVERDPRTAAAAAAYLAKGVRAFLNVAVVEEGRVQAILYVQAFHPRRWSEEDVAFARAVADRAWAAAERARAEAALRQSERRSREMTEAVPDVLFSAAPDGTIDYASSQLARLANVEPAEIVGTDMWPELVHPDDRQRVRAEWFGAVRDRRSFSIRYRLRHAAEPEAAYCWVVVRARPIYDDAGALVRWFGTVTDVDALTRAEEEVRQLNATLEERVEERTAQVQALSRALALAEQEERRRIAYVLHDDLQQQLYGLSITLGLLAGAPPDSVERLRVRAEETLGGAIQLTRSLAHDLSPPLLRGRDLAELLEWLAEQKRALYGLDVEVDVSDDVRGVQEDVRVLLYQLLREVLFNVVKHAGTRRARVVAEQVAGALRVTVEDDGRGFEPADLEETGRGMGLASVRERLGLIGGRCAVDSAPGEGTRVTLVLPAEPFDP